MAASRGSDTHRVTLTDFFFFKLSMPHLSNKVRASSTGGGEKRGDPQKALETAPSMQYTPS